MNFFQITSCHIIQSDLSSFTRKAGFLDVRRGSDVIPPVIQMIWQKLTFRAPLIIVINRLQYCLKKQLQNKCYMNNIYQNTCDTEVNRGTTEALQYNKNIIEDAGQIDKPQIQCASPSFPIISAR